MLQRQKVIAIAVAVILLIAAVYFANQNNSIIVKAPSDSTQSSEAIAEAGAADANFNVEKLLEKYKECAKIRMARVDALSQEKYEKKLARRNKPRPKVTETLEEFQEKTREQTQAILALSQADFEKRLAKVGNCGGHKKDASKHPAKGKIEKDGRVEKFISPDGGSVLVQLPYGTSGLEDSDSDDELVGFKPL